MKWHGRWPRTRHNVFRITNPSINLPHTASVYQRRGGPSSLLRSPGGVPLRRSAGDGARADDVDAPLPAAPALIRGNIRTITATPSFIATTGTLVPIKTTNVAAAAITTVTHPTAVIAPPSVYDPGLTTPITINQHQLIGAAATIFNNISDTATIVIPAIVIQAAPSVSPDAPTSAGGGPPLGVGVARGVVVVMVPFPSLGGGDDGRGVQDERATAATTDEIAAVTISSVSTSTRFPPAPAPSSFPWAMLIDDSSSGAMDESSLLLMAATMMSSICSTRGSGGLSGFPH